MPQGARPHYGLSAADERQRKVEEVLLQLVALGAPRPCKYVEAHLVTNSISPFSD